jgi:hypothetical protein
MLLAICLRFILIVVCAARLKKKSQRKKGEARLPAGNIQKSGKICISRRESKWAWIKVVQRKVKFVKLIQSLFDDQA